MRYYQITPLDTLFFRDGSPLNPGQMEVKGVFPPSPTTVAGSLRVAFARQLGWKEDRRSRSWDASFFDKLGDGDDLGPLRFCGPYLARNEELLFPAPLHLLRASGTKHLSRLKPGDELRTDIGVARMPEVEKKYDAEGEIGGFKPLEDTYLTFEAMRVALNGELPDPGGIIPTNELWASEARIGIERNRQTRTAEEGMLYQTVHTRLSRGVVLVMGADGYDGSVPEISTLGGESRMVGLDPYERFILPEAPGIQPSGGALRYTVTLITPAAGVIDRPGDTLPGNVVSACVGKPVMIGGWDSRTSQPKGLEPHLPAGSVWFMEARGTEKEEIVDHHGAHIGGKTEWGYGQILIGAWK